MEMAKPANCRESARKLPPKSLHFNASTLAPRLHSRASMIPRIEPAPNDSVTLFPALVLGIVCVAIAAGRIRFGA